MKRIAIIGAGLTGLSAAYHLGGGCEIFERESEVGGLCRTMERDGFLFDYTGHLLHLRQDYTKDLLQQLLPNHYKQHTRKAHIFSQNRYINYPFQANIHSLPPEVIKECIIGFVETLNKPPVNTSTPFISFEDWVLQTFGLGIAKHFMFPYNQKLWRTPLKEIAADWVSWSIPKPTLDEFLNGALGIQNRAFGYNPTFLYPQNGGASQLPEAFVPYLNADCLHFQKKVVDISIKHRTICFVDGSTYQYEQLISTIPLKHFAGMLSDAPQEVVYATQQLRYISVYNINIGVKRHHIADSHWIYFPDPTYIFYRVGFPMNFSDAVTPFGCSSMYVEVSALPGKTIPEQKLLKAVYAGLQRCGVLKKTDEILVCDTVRIECAYVIHDLKRAYALQIILPYLRQNNIYSIGRYGSWKYSAMEDAIIAGKQVVETLK